MPPTLTQLEDELLERAAEKRSLIGRLQREAVALKAALSEREKQLAEIEARVRCAAVHAARVC